MNPHPLETHLRELRDIHSSSAVVKETSYYGQVKQSLYVWKASAKV